MRKLLEIKNKKIGYRKYINEIGWREFSHSLLYNFPEMENVTLEKNLTTLNGIKMKNYFQNGKKDLQATLL